ncbi:MAG: Crp/Fnr family transcriptional regulator [Deltaproteobacteria bacterium]|nr:Crp/Fnr family transcriptional regulator [Deltaproteobacteria bacterium]
MTENLNVDLVAWFGRTSLFAGMEEAYLIELSRIAEVSPYKRKTLIFSEGDAGNGFYLVKQGKVKIFKISPDGKEQILHVFGSGEPFGEVPVFAGKSFPAHAVTLEDSVLVFLPRPDFVDLVARNPALSLNLLAALSQRLRQFTKMIDDLSLKEVPGRLAAHLLYLSARQAGQDRLQLELSKTQLAGLLGTIPETLSRMLAKLQKEKLIRIEGSQVVITNRRGLTDLAEMGKF